MKKLSILSIVAFLLGVACSKEKDNVVDPTSPKDLPLQMVLDSDEEGGVEDEDKAEVVFTFTDRVDVSGEELGGVLTPLKQTATVTAQIESLEGFANITDYIKGMEAYYEIDDCTTSADEDKDLDLVYNEATGEFSFTFPAGVEEVIVEIELDEDLFDDDIVSDNRGFEVVVLGLSNTSENVVINTDVTFEK